MFKAIIKKKDLKEAIRSFRESESIVFKLPYEGDKLFLSWVCSARVTLCNSTLHFEGTNEFHTNNEFMLSKDTLNNICNYFDEDIHVHNVYDDCKIAALQFKDGNISVICRVRTDVPYMQHNLKLEDAESFEITEEMCKKMNIIPRIKESSITIGMSPNILSVKKMGDVVGDEFSIDFKTGCNMKKNAFINHYNAKLIDYITSEEGSTLYIKDTYPIVIERPNFRFTLAPMVVDGY